MRPATRLIGCLAALALLAGCAGLSETSSEPSPGEEATAAVRPANEVVKLDRGLIVFRARYELGRGPCVEVRGGRAMVAEDAFEVIEVVRGKLAASTIQVRYRSGHAEGYPGQLTVGKVYTLRLTPSAETKDRLRENDEKGHSFLHIEGTEIEEERPTR
jgi:hypothetical protein